MPSYSTQEGFIVRVHIGVIKGLKTLVGIQDEELKEELEIFSKKSFRDLSSRI